jgi:hypothetical protein
VGHGPLRVLITKLDADATTPLKKNFIAFHDDFATELGICIPREYWIITGQRR